MVISTSHGAAVVNGCLGLKMVISTSHGAAVVNGSLEHLSDC